MKFLLLIGFMFALSVSFSAPTNHFGVTVKKEYVKASEVKSVSVEVLSYDLVDFNYSSVATLANVYEVRFFSNSNFANIYLTSLGFDSSELLRNKCSPINI
jgi:hypothetical protein